MICRIMLYCPTAKFGPPMLSINIFAYSELHCAIRSAKSKSKHARAYSFAALNTALSVGLLSLRGLQQQGPKREAKNIGATVFFRTVFQRHQTPKLKMISKNLAARHQAENPTPAKFKITLVACSLYVSSFNEQSGIYCGKKNC